MSPKLAQMSGAGDVASSTVLSSKKLTIQETPRVGKLDNGRQNRRSLESLYFDNDPASGNQDSDMEESDVLMNPLTPSDGESGENKNKNLIFHLCSRM